MLLLISSMISTRTFRNDATKSDIARYNSVSKLLGKPISKIVVNVHFQLVSKFLLERINSKPKKDETYNDSRVDEIKRCHQISTNRDSILSTKVEKLFTALWSSFSDRHICLLGISLFEFVMRNDVFEFFLLCENFCLK